MSDWDLLIDVEYAEWLRPSIKDLVRRVQQEAREQAEAAIAAANERAEKDWRELREWAEDHTDSVSQAVLGWLDRREALRSTPRDACQFCQGEKGGTPGNENRLENGAIACDYCHALLIAPAQEPKHECSALLDRRCVTCGRQFDHEGKPLPAKPLPRPGWRWESPRWIPTHAYEHNAFTTGCAHDGLDGFNCGLPPEAHPQEPKPLPLGHRYEPCSLILHAQPPCCGGSGRCHHVADSGNPDCGQPESAHQPPERRKQPLHPGAIGAIPPDWKNRREPIGQTQPCGHPMSDQKSAGRCKHGCVYGCFSG